MATPNLASDTSPSYPPTTPRRTASSLLQQFIPGVRTAHKMDEASSRRVHPTISYAESPGSTTQSPLKSPPYQQDVTTLDDDDDDEDELAEEEEEIQYTTARNRSGLRDRKINRSVKALENGDKSAKRGRSHKKSAIDELIGGDLTPVVSQRMAIRQEIATKTAANRNRFLVEMKDFWLPLLPTSKRMQISQSNNVRRNLKQSLIEKSKFNRRESRRS